MLGDRERIAILIATTAGTPKVYARATSNDAIGDVLGLLADLDIRIPQRRAALDHTRRALDDAPIDATIPRPAKRDAAWVDALDCVDGAGSCLDGIELASSCAPDCDIGCDPGCL